MRSNPIAILAAALLIGVGGCGEDPPPPPPPPPPPTQNGGTEVTSAPNKAEFVFFQAADRERFVRAPEPPFIVKSEPASDSVAGDEVIAIVDRVNEALTPIPIECGGQPDHAYPGTVQYKFELPKDDDYVVFVHANFQDDCANSVFARVDDGMIYRIEYAVATESNSLWKWTCPMSEGNPVAQTLKAGAHTLTLLNREDGIKIDQILICSKRLARKFDGTQAPLKKK